MLRDVLSSFARHCASAGLARLRAAPATPLRLGRRYRGAHEVEIARMFKGATMLGPGSYRGRMLVVVGFTNRRGSNLTANLMAKSRLTTSALEMLNADSVRRSGLDAGRGSAQAYMDWLTKLGPESLPFAIKGSHDQLAMLLRWGAREAFDGMRVVHVVREDVLAQAVSHSIAAQTRKWASFQPGLDVEPVFDPRDILRRMDSVAGANARIVEICRVAGLPHLRVAYEDVVAEPLPQLRRIAAFLGRDLARAAAPAPDLSRQADALNAEFVRRFQAWACRRGKLGTPSGGRPAGPG